LGKGVAHVPPGEGTRSQWVLGELLTYKIPSHRTGGAYALFEATTSREFRPSTQDPSVTERQAQQIASIAEGVRSGTITGAEARRLLTEQVGIANAVGQQQDAFGPGASHLRVEAEFSAEALRLRREHAREVRARYAVDPVLRVEIRRHAAMPVACLPAWHPLCAFDGPVQQAEHLEGAKAVLVEGDVVPLGADARRALAHRHGPAALQQRHRDGEPGEAPAGDHSMSHPAALSSLTRRPSWPPRRKSNRQEPVPRVWTRSILTRCPGALLERNANVLDDSGPAFHLARQEVGEAVGGQR